MNPAISFLRSMGGKVFVPHLERKLRRFEHQLHHARRVQREILFAKIRRCAQSQFGRDHLFEQIHNLDDFRKQVPIAQYDYYLPYIRQVSEGNVTAMFPPDEKILMFTLSSGTTDDPKLIPVNKIWMDEYRRGWQIWGVKAFLDHPALFYAKLAGMAGNWDMRRTPTGIPCGMASGLSARLQNPLLRMVYCIPASVFEIEDVSAKYYTALRLAVPEPAGLFLTATPATLVKFAKLADQYSEILIRDIANGTLTDRFDIPESVRQEVHRRIRRPNLQRARELQSIVDRTGHLYPKDFWDLSLAACWLGGTVGTYAQHIPNFYGDVACRDIGLLCSEGRFTIPFSDDTPSGALEITSHYFEFIPESEIDSPNPIVLECHELEENKNYFILLTTSSGLYRYNIYDLLRCTGYLGETPLLEFLNKGQRFSDMEGEKLSEFHLVKAVTEVTKELGVGITGFTAVPIRPTAESSLDSPLEPPYYVIMVEQQDLAGHELAVKFLEHVDRWLADHNVMYQGKRADLYLGPLHLVRIPTGSWAKYDLAEIQRRKAGEDHYKHPCLVLEPEFLNRFPNLEEIIPPQPTLVA